MLDEKFESSKKSVLVVDDEFNIRALLKEQFLTRDFEVEVAEDGVQAMKVLQQRNFDLVLTDIKMPRVSGLEILKYVKDNYPDTEVIVMTAFGDMQIAIDSMKMKAYDFLVKPFNFEQLFLTIDRALEKHKLEIDNKALKLRLDEIKRKEKIIGSSKSLIDVLDLARRVAVTNSNVLITGESGTGKELLASFVHSNSRRKENPFVTINCASIPDTLLESELFGHEKGSFTDAYQLKQGLVEIAKNGTLFLDEIGDISLIIQPKLLRFIEAGEFRRIGGTHNFMVDVRIIAATNKDLREEVKNGKFREDLFYRLNVVSLNLPPLRERKDDIPVLIKYFLSIKAPYRNNKYFSDDAISFMQEYNWPGNIRELEHIIDSSIIFSKADCIGVSDIPIKIDPKKSQEPAFFSPASQNIITLDEMEKVHIVNALKSLDWNQTKAAKALNISQKTLYTKIKKYNILK
jgi:DNA-binding NtrC family response regulator